MPTVPTPSPKDEAQTEQERCEILSRLTAPLLSWYDRCARDLPWRVSADSGARPDPYHVWVSEIMLQQTRVEAVKNYYTRFLEQLPDVQSLAEISPDVLMKLWQGLGYYSRARNLQKAAQQIMDDYQGDFPGEYEQLLLLPGIGAYTAGAIASIAFGRAVPAIDGNVIRIYTRLFADDADVTKTSFARQLRRILQQVIPAQNPGSYNQAWMDLGACICLPNGAPQCDVCPLSSACQAAQQQTWSHYPVKPPKKKRRIEEKTIFLLEYHGTCLLQKRPPHGLLAGLWEFPSQDRFLSAEELPAFLASYGTDAAQIELLGSAKHIFTHIEWHMIGYYIHLHNRPTLPLSAESCWVDPQKMQRDFSIPSAFQYYYSKLLPH